MEQNKISFFTKLKNAITNFDSYIDFSEEKLWTAIKYILKLLLVFTLVVTFSLTYKVAQKTNKAIEIFKEECPEFYFNNNSLVTNNSEDFYKGDKERNIGILVSSQKEDLKDITKSINYDIFIGILKDKIVIKNSENVQTSITYEQINNRYMLNNLSKAKVIEFLQGSNIIKIYLVFILISLIYLYATYLVQILLDILLLSIVAYLVSRIVGVKFKYKGTFNISIYAISLSVLLYMVYISVNLLTSFNIKYFDIAYNLIAYIYVITAILTIKTELIRQQIEVSKIVEEQKKIREEKERKEENKKEKEKEEEDNKEENNEDESPEESQA